MRLSTRAVTLEDPCAAFVIALLIGLSASLRRRAELQAEIAALQLRTTLKNKMRTPHQTDLRPVPAEGLLPQRHGVQNDLLS